MSFRTSSQALWILASCITACGGSQPAPEPAGTPPAAIASASSLPPAAVITDKSPADPAPAPAKAEAPKAPPPPTPVLKYTGVFATPESVLYDAVGDRYLVSNINGTPFEKDNNGYITELSPDGKVVKDKFIAGGVGGVKLNAPKGSAIAQGILYVADIDVVRKFEVKTGAPKGEIPVPGALFLNDVSAAPDGKVYVVDSAIKAGAQGFEPAGGEAVYVIEKGKLKTLAKSAELSNPNGVLAWEKGALVNTMLKAELYRLDEKGARQDVTTLPGGGLDGLVAAGDTLLVSSWSASTIYRGKLGGTFEPVLVGLPGSADIGFDTKRQRVLVPRFLDSVVEVYALP